MRRILIIVFLAGVFVLSFKKSSDTIPGSLEGTWKMILVTDNVTHVSITKPSSILQDVIITFTSSGIFTGKTPTIDINQNPYSLGANSAISIPVLSMTKVAETSWGAEFVNNITEAVQYNFRTGGILEIRTTNKKLSFLKQ